MDTLLNKFFSDWTSLRKTVVSSAYCVGFLKCVSFIDFDALYFIWTPNSITQNFYPNSKQDARERAALSDTSFQIKLPSSKAVVKDATWNVTICYIYPLS